jgi:predicted ATPase
MPVKGLGEPVEVYEVLGVGQSRTRLQAAAARGFTRFVGRDAEIETLRQTLARAGQGHGQVVGLVGEPGVGKSRLVWEFTHSHRAQDWLVLESSSVSYGNATSYLPVIDLLKAYCAIESRDEPRRVRERIAGKVLMLDEALRPTLPALLALLDVPVDDPAWEALDPPRRRQRTLDALKRLLLRESQEQPLLLVCEDLHWIDTETQAMLDGLVESLPGARVLLLVNYRPEYQHGWGSKTYYTQLRLDPLPPESADALLQALLGDAADLASLKRLLVERTEGNPFFLEESVRALEETGALVGERGAYRLAQPVERMQVPATVQAILAARIDRLAPEDKRLLQSAAVIGKDVPYAILQAIAELPEEPLRQALARLQAAELLYETRLFPELEYTFKHALTHEVAYGGLLADRRRALHAQIVAAIERLYPDRQAEQVELLAHHALRAEVWEQAVAYLHQAGRKAAARSAQRAAVAYLEQALDALARLPESRDTLERAVAIRLDLGPALVATRGQGSSDIERTYAEAHALCERLGETPHLFPVLWGLARSREARGELRAARELGEELFAAAERAQDPALLLEAHHSQVATLFLLGELAPALDHAERVVALYDPKLHAHHAFLYGGHDAGVCGLQMVGRTLWLRGQPDCGLQRTQEALALARSLSHPFSEGFALHHLVWIHRQRGEPHLMRTYLDALLELIAEHGFRYFSATGITQGWLLAEQGELAEGLAQMRQSLAFLQAASQARGITYSLALLAEVCGKAGEVGEGLRTVDQALARAQAGGERLHEAELRRIQGDLLLRQAARDAEHAEACYRQALAVAREQGARAYELRAATSLARLWQEQGKRAEAQQLLGEVYGQFSEGLDTADLVAARALLDALA